MLMARVQATVAAAEAAAPAPAAELEAGREGMVGGRNGREGVEDYLRGVFQAHTQSLLDLAVDGAQTKNSRAREGTRKLALANSYRIQALRQRAGLQVRGRRVSGGGQCRGRITGKVSKSERRPRWTLIGFKP